MSADMTTAGETMREHVAGEVRAEMARKRVSGRELSRLTGTSQMYWGRRISGAVAFDVDDLATVAAILDVPVTDLFRGVSAPVANSHYRGRPGRGTGHDGPHGTARAAWELAA